MLSPTGERRPRPRMETLADLIFGLSLSIGSIALIANSPANAPEINSHILAFVFSFLILITGWMIYTTQMSVLPLESKTGTYLNVALLLLVALVPYLLNNVELANASLTPAASSSLRDYASTLFAIDLAGVQIILALRPRHQHRGEEARVAGRRPRLQDWEEHYGRLRPPDAGFGRAGLLGVDAVRDTA